MSPDEKERQTKINPAIHRFVGEMEKAGLQVSALIFDPEGDFLIKAGNTPHQGKDFVKLHYMLALVVAQLDAQGHYEKTDIVSALSTQEPQEIADKLAMLLLAMPSEMLPSRIVDLVNEYADARKG